MSSQVSNRLQYLKRQHYENEIHCKFGPTVIFVLNQEVPDESTDWGIPSAGCEDLHIFKLGRFRVSGGEHFLPADEDGVNHFRPFKLLADLDVDPFPN